MDESTSSFPEESPEPEPHKPARKRLSHWLTFALRWVDAMTVGVISQLAVLVSMALGSLFLGDRITLLAAIGAALTIGGVAGVTYVNSLAAPRAAAAVEVVPEA